MTTPNPAAPVQGISHLALAVDDVPAELRFWTEVMGFEITTETSDLGFVVHRPTRTAIALTSNQGRTQHPFDETSCGLDHLAFAIESETDLRIWQRRLQQSATVHSPITESPAGHHLNLKSPSGNPIELYSINETTAAAFGLAGAHEAHAAQRPTGEDPQVKAAARRVLEEIFPANDETALIAAVTPDFINHEAPPGTPPGPAGVLRYMNLLDEAFSSQRWTVHRVVAEGDIAVVFCTHSGRHTGDYFGVPATGRNFAYQQMHMIRIEDGKGAEHWAVRDDAALMRQLTGPIDTAHS